jgi:hypothetical protein
VTVRPVHLAVVAAGTILALYATLLLDASTVDWLASEDGPFEYLTALALFVTGLLFAAGYVRLRRADPGAATGIWKRRSFLLLGLVFLVGAGEEVSWGQRILGIGTPEGLAGANAQSEINVHNLKPVAGVTYQLFLVGWYSLVLVVPVVAALYAPARRRLRRLVPIVPLWLGALFVLNYLVSQVALLAAPLLSDVRAAALESAHILDGAVGDYLAVVIVAIYPLSRGWSAEIQELAISLLAVLTAWTVLKELSHEARGSAMEGDAPRRVTPPHAAGSHAAGRGGPSPGR